MGRCIMELTDLTQINSLIQLLREKLAAVNIPQESFLDIQLVITEAVGNAFLHGTKGLKNPKVMIELHICNNSISMRIKDNGSGFDYRSFRDFGEFDILAEKGRGLFLISKIVDELRFNDKGNEIYCLKKW